MPISLKNVSEELVGTSLTLWPASTSRSTKSGILSAAEDPQQHKSTLCFPSRLQPARLLDNYKCYYRDLAFRFSIKQEDPQHLRAFEIDRFEPSLQCHRLHRGA